MSNIERRTVCVDDNVDVERGRLPVLTDRGTTRKRPHSTSTLSSTRTYVKLIRKSTTERRPEALADEETSSQGTHHGKSRFVVGHEGCNAQGNEGPGIEEVRMELQAGICGTLPKASNRVNRVSASQTVLEQSLDQLQSLSQDASDLGLQQQRNVLAAERLQERMTKSERTYGELLRDSIELQRSIEERRKQIKTDKQELQNERAAAKTTGDKLCAVLATMRELSRGISSMDAKESRRNATSA